MVERFAEPENPPATSLAQKVGLSQSTRSSWLEVHHVQKHGIWGSKAARTASPKLALKFSRARFGSATRHGNGKKPAKIHRLMIQAGYRLNKQSGLGYG